MEDKEVEANTFAMELLMPREMVEKDVSELGGIDYQHDKRIKQLANRYEVSEQSMIIRLSQLKLFGG